MVNRLSPDYLSSFILPSVIETSRYKLRNSNDIQGYYNAFLSSSLIEWNKLPDDIQNTPLLSSCKCLLDRNIKMCPKHFYIGIRQWLIYHARLQSEVLLTTIFTEEYCKCTSMTLWTSGN
jgi:hypothetical protein